MNYVNAGIRMREARKLKGLSQAALADLTGFSVMSVRRYESGERHATVSIFETIANILDIDVNYLMHGQTLAERDAAYLQSKNDSIKRTLAANELFKTYGFSFGLSEDGKTHFVTDPKGKTSIFNNEQWLQYGTALLSGLRSFSLSMHEQLIAEILGEDTDNA